MPTRRRRRVKPLRACRLRGASAKQEESCWDIVDKARKAKTALDNAEVAVYERGTYRKGEYRTDAIARLAKMRQKYEALEARFKAMGC